MKTIPGCDEELPTFSPLRYRPLLFDYIIKKIYSNIAKILGIRISWNTFTSHGNIKAQQCRHQIITKPYKKSTQRVPTSTRQWWRILPKDFWIQILYYLAVVTRLHLGCLMTSDRDHGLDTTPGRWGRCLLVVLHNGTGNHFNDVAENIIILREAPVVARICNG